MDATAGKWRIGELARRTGLTPAVLRAWEQRYGVIEPQRSPGGTRLYSERDAERIRAMQHNMAAGLSAAEAARAALAARSDQAVAEAGSSELGRDARALHAALTELDRERAERALDRLLAAFTFETVALSVILPYLIDVGERWERAEASVAEEHLATQILRGRLLGLTRGRPSGSRARAVLACPPAEHHDIALVMCSVALERQGWRVAMLGANTPISSITHAAEVINADCVVLAATTPEPISAAGVELAGLAAGRPLLLAGAGAGAQQARDLGALWLTGDPVGAAARIDRWLARRRDGRGGDQMAL